MKSKQAQKITAIYPGAYAAGKPQEAPIFPAQKVRPAKKQATVVINPLVDAAKLVFNAVSDVHAQTEQQGVSEHLQEDLISSIRAFVVRAGQLGYNQELVLVARYMLSATLEEAITRSMACEPASENTSRSLLKTLDVEPLTADQWQTLMTRLCSDPVHHIDLLEFVYLCLRLDLKGHYQYESFGEEQRLAFTDQLYQLITQIRGETSFLLSPKGLSRYEPEKPVKARSFKPWHAWVIAVVLSAMVYGFFSYSYVESMNPLVDILKQSERVLLQNHSGQVIESASNH